MTDLRACEKLRSDVEALGPWFQNLHLPGGVMTAPHHGMGDFPRFKWNQFAPHLPEDLRGYRVLDIGCNAGFYSFALAERGADVVGLDSDPHYLRQARWAQRQLGWDKVAFRQGQVYDLVGWSENFDLILFMGVFYHLRYPMLALDIVARLGAPILIFQSLTFGNAEDTCDTGQDLDFGTRQAFEQAGWPKLAFVETTFDKDPTNWWVPNPAAVETLLRAAGFSVEARPAHEIYLCRRTPEITRVPLSEEEFQAAAGVSRRPRNGA